MKPTTIKKIVLAYSDGLDTSVILKWLQETDQAEIIAFCADLGQGEGLKAVKIKHRRKRQEGHVEDLRDLRHDPCLMLRGNAMYEGWYFLGTSIARR